MRTFIQLQNNIGFSTVIVPSGEPDHSVTPNNITAVEVFTDNADQFLGKLYNQETNSWSDAPVIYYSEINQAGEIVEVRRTVFAHEVPANSQILSDNITAQHRYIDGEWVAPVVVEPVSQPAPPPLPPENPELNIS